MQLLQPAMEDGEGSSGSSSKTAVARSSCQQRGAAILLQPLANLRPVEVVQVALAAAACRMNRRHLLQCLLDEFLTQSLAEHLQNDAITDTEEQMQRCRNDAFGIDFQQCWLIGVKRLAISFSAVTRRVEVVVV